MHGALLGGGSAQVTLTVVANTTNYNLFTAAGSPSSAVDVYVTVAAGVTIGTTGTGKAFTTGIGWATGSRLTLVNNGSAEGFGGHGNSGDGGDAIELLFDMTVDNTNGYIRAGAGGGGIGASEGATNPALSGAGGGSGGGGQGNPGGTHGNGNGSYAASGGNGNDGSTSNYGLGGGGGSNSFYGTFGGPGGRGGTWGQAGIRGGQSSPSHTQGSAGGAAGFAVRLNGHTVTWLGGNNSTQVLGTVG